MEANLKLRKTQSDLTKNYHNNVVDSWYASLYERPIVVVSLCPKMKTTNWSVTQASGYCLYFVISLTMID